MSFFYAQTKAQAARVKHQKSGRPSGMPVDILRASGCKWCPNNTQKQEEGPRLPPNGSDRPSVYVLTSGPSLNDDHEGFYCSDSSWDKLLVRPLLRGFRESEVRFGGVSQCASRDKPEPEVLECCHSWFVKDIEQSRPYVVLAVGPIAMARVTGLGGGVGIRRGRMIPTRIGNHSCWVVCVPEPSWVEAQIQRSYSGADCEEALLYKHELETLYDRTKELDPPDLPSLSEIDRGIEYITGNDSYDLDRLEDAFKSMWHLESVGVDYESNSLSPYRVSDPKLYLAAIGTEDRTFAFCLDHPQGWLTEKKRRAAWTMMGDFLKNAGPVKFAHNLSMEQKWTEHFFGKELLYVPTWGDTMAQAHTIDSRVGTMSLDDVCRMQLGFFLKAQSDVDPVRLLEYPLLPDKAPRKSAMRYNALDTKWAHAVSVRQAREIRRLGLPLHEYERKVRLAPALVITESKGLPVDMDYADELDAKYTSQLKGIESRLKATPEVGTFERKFGPFSPTNPDNVLRLMRDVLGRKEVAKDDGKSFTTDESALSSMPAKEVPSAPLVLEHRQLAKLLSTYIQPIRSRKIVCPDGHMHPNYNSMVAISGRLSSDDPNAQNFPKRKNAEVRGVVPAYPGHTFTSIDYGQIEARVIGMASEDANLVKYLWTDYDIHGVWAGYIFDAYPRWFDILAKEFGADKDDEAKLRKLGRQESKNKWVFPQFFGAHAGSCARNLKVPEDVMSSLARRFWDEFSGVKRWQERLIKNYTKNFYVETLTGQRRWGALSKNEIINTPIQGTAAHIVQEAMGALALRSVLEDDPYLAAHLNVHDDLSFIFPTESLTDYISTVVAEMCRPRFDFINVPLLVEVSTGDRWYGVKEIGKFRSDELFSIPNPYRKK